MNEQEILTQFYGSYDEEHRLSRDRRGFLEFHTTMHYIEKYLSCGCHVLEVGAGPGRYSLALAEKGCDVTAVELVEHNLAVLKSHITSNMRIQALQGNALDLSQLEDASFDLTLVLGPIYHLFSEAEKQQAISETLQATKSGGIVMVAYCIADASLVEYGFKAGQIHELMEKNMVDSNASKIIDLFELVTKQDVDRLMEHFSVERLHYVATDGFSYFMQRELEEMDEAIFRRFVDYHMTICERADLVGATAHSLDIFRKL